jgi:hypothetical protein
MKSMLEGPEVVFFISDGTCDWGEFADQSHRAFEEAESWNRYRQIRFHAFGVGDHDYRVLANLRGMTPEGAYVVLP